MSPPYFLDKFAPELRVAIYGYVLGSSKIIKPNDSTATLGIDNEILALTAQAQPKHTTIETCMLATSKLVYKEATQVLYHNKTFRATFPELKTLLQHENFVANVERVEVADCANIRGRSDLSECSSILKKLQESPHILSIVILSDCLSGLVPHELNYWGTQNLVQLVTVPYFMQSVAGLGPATCVDIGRYALHGEYSGAQVVNRKLTTLWPSAQDVPADYDAWAHLESLMQTWQVLADVPDQMALTVQTSFKCWVGLHEEMASMETSGKLDEMTLQEAFHSISDSDMATLRLARQWGDMTLHCRLSSLPYFTYQPRVQEPKALNLRHLKPGDDPNILSWATEYLAANVAVFRCDSRWDPALNKVAAQHWVELDGGTPLIEQRIQQQKLAIAGLPNSRYVLEPVRRTSLLAHARMKYAIEAERLDRLATRYPSGELDPREFLQLAQLCIATITDRGFLGLPTDANYQQELDEWASDYLKRHLIVSEWVDSDVVRAMSLADMRKSFSILLARPSLKELRTDPPEGLDADLFLPLAWKRSWEYTNICIEHHEAGQEAESSSDWEQGGPESGADSEGED